MTPQIAKIIGIVVIMTMLGAAAYFIYEAGADSVRVEAAEKVKKATAKARKEEQDKQGKINEINQKQYDSLVNINANLNTDLNGLRKRASRRHLPKNSKSVCKGVTGEHLSSEDSRFLTREAARADRLRTALKACYKYADTIVKK